MFDLKKYRKEYYQKNKDKYDARSKLYRQNNRMKMRLYDRNYYMKHQVRIKARNVSAQPSAPKVEIPLSELDSNSRSRLDSLNTG